MSVKKVLYVGTNPKLVETLLTTVSDGNEGISYDVKHTLCVNEVVVLLAESDYHYFISEQAISEPIQETIKRTFPSLKAVYLNSSPVIAENLVSPSEKELISEDVKKVLNCISIPIYYKNEQSDIIVCNQSFASHLGMKPEDIIGRNIAEFLPHEIRTGLNLVDKDMETDRRAHLYECELHDIQGIAKEVVFRKQFVGATDIQIGLVFDVTDLNEARRNIEKERMMLRATADISTDLIFFKDLQSRFIGCNKQFEKFIGQPEHHILGKTDEQFFAIEQAKMCQQQDHDVMLNVETYSGEEYLTFVDGERHFIDMKKVPLFDNEGAVQGLIGIGRDITAHHRLQKRLKVANTVFENSQESIIVTDQVGQIVSINHSACRLFGVRKSELLGQAVRGLLPQDFDSVLFKEIGEKIEKEGVWKGDITYHNKLGEIRFAWLDVYVVELEVGVSNIIYSFTDLSQNKSIESKIQFLSKHDPLTELPNRIALFTKLEDAIIRARFNETALAVLLIDINDFKIVNDQHGHNEGDKALQQVAARLKNCVSEKDTVARFGDDEFVIVVDNPKNEHDGALVAQKVTQEFSRQFTIADLDASLGATIGISLYPDDGIDADTLLLNAENAMLRAQKDKHSSYHFYTGQLTQQSSEQLQLEEELNIGLQENQFELYYQPQYDLNKKLIVAMESLWRWNHPKLGILLPDQFLSLAEESGLLVELGLQMLKEVALQTVRWKKANIFFGRIAVHFSATQLEQISLIADIQTIVKETGCCIKDIEFEVDEATFDSHNYSVHENLFNLHKLGVAITISGFGADIPVFHYIEPLGIEKFKIAESYLQHVPGPVVSHAMIKSVMSLARELGVDVVGEMIDNNDQQAFMHDLDISAAATQHPQPMRASEATFYLRCHKKK